MYIISVIDYTCVVLHGNPVPGYRRCPVCSKEYHHKYLRKHMVVHQMERPEKCDECDKTFKDIEGLKHHKLKHRPDEEKYKVACNVCGLK